MISARHDKDKFWFSIATAFSILLIFSSLLFNSPSEIISGMKNILLSSGVLLTDYMKTGNIGSALLNAGIMTLFGVLFLYLSNTEVSGVAIAGLINLTAFSFFGKNPYNSLSLMFGVYLYSKFMRERFYMYTPIALFATGATPAVSYATFYVDLPLLQGIIFGNLIGILIGFLLSAVSVNAKNLHRGFNLYNNGLALGFIVVTVFSVFKLSGHEMIHESTSLAGVDPKLFLLIAFIFFMLISGKLFIAKNGFKDYFEMLKETGVSPSDFIEKYDKYTVLFNMGLLGFLGLAYVSLTGSNLNGVTLGGIFGMVAFGCFGLHLKNATPILIGVFLAGWIGMHEVTSDAIVIAAFFGTCLAPVAGDFGALAGIITGFLHLSVVSRTAFLHGGLLLYNNGFTAGIITAVVVPFFHALRLNLRSINRRFF